MNRNAGCGTSLRRVLFRELQTCPTGWRFSLVNSREVEYFPTKHPFFKPDHHHSSWFVFYTDKERIDMHLRQFINTTVLVIGTLLISNQVMAAPGPPDTSDPEVELNYQLSVSPLELPIGPEPNVLIVNDDSGSMSWDIMADGNGGRFRLPSGWLVRWALITRVPISR